MNCFLDAALQKKLFEWAKTEQGWPLVRAALSKNNAIASWTGGKWGETLLHWAALGDLGSTMDLIAAGAPVDVADKTGRTPLSWAVEKAYFLRTDPPKEMPDNRLRRMIDAAEACALTLLAQGADAGKRGDGQGYFLDELALAAGIKSLSAELLRRRPDGSARSERLWAAAIQGQWLDLNDLGQLIEFLPEPPSGVPARAAVELWLSGSAKLSLVVWVHNNVERIDAPSSSWSFEEACSKAANGGQREAELVAALDL